MSRCYPVPYQRISDPALTMIKIAPISRWPCWGPPGMASISGVVRFGQLLLQPVDERLAALDRTNVYTASPRDGEREGFFKQLILVKERMEKTIRVPVAILKAMISKWRFCGKLR